MRALSRIPYYPQHDVISAIDGRLLRSVLLPLPLVLLSGWAWLVTAGLAPVILSTLPCLIMCGLGVCFMCRTSNKETASPSVDATTSALGIAKTEAPLVAGLSCCQGAINTNSANAFPEDSSEKWKEESHA